MRVQRIALAAMLILVAGCSARRPAANVQPLPESSRFALGEGREVFVPCGFDCAGRSPDIVVHFHGVASVTEREFAAAGVDAVLLTVNYRGLSAAYEKPLSDPALFGELLDETLSELKRRALVATDARWGRVFVSSFSAGFGAVRAILNNSDYFGRVDGLLLADTVYAGYVESDGRRVPNPANMKPFRQFAAEAEANRKYVFLTHTYLQPDGYAGTHETADDLIAFVGAQRTDGSDDAPPPLRVVSIADAGGFHVRGCAGTTGDEHMQHLRNLRWGLGKLPVRRLALASRPASGP